LLQLWHSFADTININKNIDNEQQEFKHMRSKQGEIQRKWQQGKIVERKGYIMPTTKFNFWDILTSFHPYQNEILCIVRMLNGLGVGPEIIAVSLNLQKWKTFFGSAEWKDQDIKIVLNYLNHKDTHIQSSLMTTDQQPCFGEAAFYE
jgi:hypothetical protein